MRARPGRNVESRLMILGLFVGVCSEGENIRAMYDSFVEG
jgi:hypothetical protein